MTIILNDKHYLGTLCKRGHDYNGTGKSLRGKHRSCVECQLYNQKKRRSTETGKKKNCEYTKKYYRENPKKFIDKEKKRIALMSKEEKSEFYKKQYRGNRKNRLDSVKKHRLKNLEKIKLYQIKNNFRRRNWGEVINIAKPHHKKWIEAWIRWKISILNLQQLIKTEEYSL